MHIIPKVDAALKAKLEPLFTNHHRVDFGIDSILEGQSGKQINVTVDNIANPQCGIYSVWHFWHTSW